MNKKKAGRRREFQQEIMERYVSPEYGEIINKDFNGEISLTNVRDLYVESPGEKIVKCNNYTEEQLELARDVSSNEEDSDDSNEDIEDYRIDGYHPVHIK